MLWLGRIVNESYFLNWYAVLHITQFMIVNNKCGSLATASFSILLKTEFIKHFI